MGLLDLFKTKAPGIEFRQSGGMNRIWSQSPKAETTRLPDRYHQSPRFDPVDMIAEAIGNAPPVLYDRRELRLKKNEAKQLTDHPAVELLETPSSRFPELDGQAFMKMTAIFKILLGEAFWIKFRSGSKIDELIFVPPSWVTRVPTSGAPSFQITPYGATSGRSFQVAPEDMVWFKTPDIADPYGRGRGRTEAVGDEADADEMAAKFQKNYFYNDGTPPLLINIPGATQAQVEQFRDSWAQRVGGWLNARKPAITGGETEVKVTKLADTAKEMDFVTSRQFLRDEFLHHYRIPPEMMGILTNSNRSTIDSAEYLFLKNAVMPEKAFIERAITTQLIRPDFDDRLCLVLDMDIPEDEEFRLRKVNEGVSRGMLTRAEWRQAMGYKVRPGDDVLVIPATLIEVAPGQTIQEAKPAPVAPAFGPAPAVDTADDEKPEKAAIIDILFKAVGSEKRKAWEDFDRKAADGEPGFIFKVKDYAKKQRARFGTIEPTKAGIDKAIARAFDGADKALQSALASPWADSMADGYALAKVRVTGTKAPFVAFDIVNKRFLYWIATAGLKKAKEINETTQTQLREKMNAELIAGIEAGESMDKLAARLAEVADGVYDNMSASRAKLVARTETMGAVNFGQWATYSEAGVEKKEWLSTPDEDTREAHRVGEPWGQPYIVGIDEPFIIDGEELQYPGASGGSAGNVCRCRCTVLAVMK